MEAKLRFLTACSTLAFCLAGCQICHPALKKACVESDCSNEIHVKAPPQRVVIHRDDCEPPTVPCDDKPAPATTPEPAKRPTPSQPAQQPPQPMAVPQGGAYAPMAAASGFAAVPTLPSGTALTLTFDIIRIPIPIPRLRTVDVPPEARLSYVQIPAQPPAPAVVPMMQPAYVQQVDHQAAQACIPPEQLAAALTIVKAQQSRAKPAAATASDSSDLAEVQEQMKALQNAMPNMSKMMDKLEKQVGDAEAKKAGQKGKSKGDDGWQTKADK